MEVLVFKKKILLLHSWLKNDMMRKYKYNVNGFYRSISKEEVSMQLFEQLVVFSDNFLSAFDQIVDEWTWSHVSPIFSNLVFLAASGEILMAFLIIIIGYSSKNTLIAPFLWYSKIKVNIYEQISEFASILTK